jgi:DNA-binding transcriptional MocR family regulator
MNASTDSHLYHQVASELRTRIDKGVYAPGERVPSVRRLSEQLQVSIATVIEAYARLESQGLIEARPQSGYYVRARLAAAPPEPAISNPVCSPTMVSVSALAMEVLKSTRDPDIVQLAVASPHPQFLPLAQLNRILARLARTDDGRGGCYDFPPGSIELRHQIVRRAADAGCTLSPDDIVTTTGCQEALSIALRAVANPGDTIAIDSPAFYGTLQTIESLGMKALEIPTHPRSGVSLDALKLALERWHVRAVLLVPNFNNPLGACMPEENKKRLVRLLAEHDTPLIEDDIYGELGYASPRPKAAKAFDRKGLVLLCSSFSKTLAPGYRVGWIAPGRYQTQVEHLKYVNTMATPTLPQLAIAEFLAQGSYDRYLRKVRTLYAQQVERVTHAITRFFPDDTKVTQPAGGFVLWVELPEMVNAFKLHRQALQRKISIAPGPLFSAKQKYENFIRINCAYPWGERFERALITLGRLAQEMS